jgi:hypothetical protein
MSAPEPRRSAALIFAAFVVLAVAVAFILGHLSGRWAFARHYAVQNAVQSVHDRDCQQTPETSEILIAEDVRQVLSIVCKSLQDKGMPLAGLEPTTH